MSDVSAPDDRQRDVRRRRAGGIERHQYDVVVIGAGGAGLRAAIAAHDAGARTAIVCKSLLGKAHTVMAEGGIAAAMGNRWPEDNWEVHFRDTMRGGKMLNNWRMAQLHAQEAPERVHRARGLGRAVRPHRRRADLPARLRRPPLRPARPRRRPHRPGDDPHPPAARRRSSASTCSWSARSPTCSRTADGAIAGAFGYWRETGRFVVFEAPAVVLATGGIGKSFKVTSQLLGVHRRRPRARAARRRVPDQHGVRPVPPDRDGLAAVGEGAAGHRVGARRRRHPEELRGQAVHVRLHPGVLQGRDGRHRGGGRPLVRRQEEQPPPARAAAARRGRPGDQLRDQGRPRDHRTAASTSTSPRGVRRSSSASGCRRCTTSSRSWPTSTSPRSRWRSARPATT